MKNKAKRFSLLDNIRLSTLENIIDLVKYLDGEIWEMGAYKGGTALFMKKRRRKQNETRNLAW